MTGPMEVMEQVLHRQQLMGQGSSVSRGNSPPHPWVALASARASALLPSTLAKRDTPQLPVAVEHLGIKAWSLGTPESIR